MMNESPGWMGVLFLPVQRSLPVSFSALKGRGKRCGRRGNRAAMTATEERAGLVESWEWYVMVSMFCGVKFWGRWDLGFLRGYLGASFLI
jgi:hypothetical protein